MRHLAAPAREDDYTTRQKLAIAWRFFTKGLLRGRPTRIVRFIDTLYRSRPGQWSHVITDWIAGLSMQNYMTRHFRENRDKDIRLANQIVQWIRQAFPLATPQAVSLSSHTDHPRITLLLKLQGGNAERFLVPTAKKLKKLMKKTATRLTLRVESLCTEQGRHVEQMLKLLADYGDRVSVYIKQELQPLISTDLSRFNLVLK